jgi:MFS family permease
LKTKNPFAIYKGLPKGIYAIFISRIIDNMGSVVMPMITLILTQKIGFSQNTTGILATIFMVSQAPFLLLGGKLVDKIGSKKVIVIFNTLGAIAYIPCGFMQPHIVMAVFIALAADLFSVAAPAYNAIVTEISPESQIKSSYSILYLGYNLGLAIGPALGGLLFNHHLQLLFFIDAFTCAASTAFVYFLVPDNLKIEKAKPKHSEQPVADLKYSVYKFIFQSPALIIFAVVLLAYNFCYSQWGFMLPLQAAGIFKENGAKYYSLLVSVNAIAVILLTPVLTSLTHRFRPLAIVAAGGIFYTLAFLIFSGGQILAQFFIAAVVMTMGQILININTNIYIAEQTPQEYIGRANSMLTIINGVGVAIGPIIMGHVLLHLHYSTAWIAVAVLMLCGASLMFILNLKSRRKIG